MMEIHFSSENVFSLLVLYDLYWNLYSAKKKIWHSLWILSLWFLDLSQADFNLLNLIFHFFNFFSNLSEWALKFLYQKLKIHCLSVTDSALNFDVYSSWPHVQICCLLANQRACFWNSILYKRWTGNTDLLF